MDKLQHLGCGHTKILKSFRAGAGFLPSTVALLSLFLCSIINHPSPQGILQSCFLFLKTSVSCACITQVFLSHLCVSLHIFCNCQELLIGDANFQPEELLKLLGIEDDDVKVTTEPRVKLWLTRDFSSSNSVCQCTFIVC